MYIKYVRTGTQIQTADDLAKLFNGTYTSASDFQYAGVGSSISGTAPSAGVYTVTDASGNEWVTDAGNNFILTKKHVQYNASTFPAITNIHVFSYTSSPSIRMRDKNSGNALALFIPNTNLNISYTDPGLTLHIIWNDTGMVMGVVQSSNADLNLNKYYTTVISDFAKTAYDEFCLSDNELYYPGCMWTSGSQGPDNNYYNQVNWIANSFAAGRYQAMNPSGTYFNTAVSSSSSGSNYHIWTASGTLGAYPTVHPRPHIRIPSIDSDPVLIPMLYDASGIAGYTYTSAIISDTRFFAVMLNNYRTSDFFGYFGDIIEDAAGTQYIIMRGHRPPDSVANTGTGAYQPTCYAFPVNNVGV